MNCNFSIYEKNVIVGLLTQVMEADYIIHPKEEELMEQLLEELQIFPGDLCIEEVSIEEYRNCVLKMDEGKRSFIKDALINMASCDGFVDPREIQIIEKLFDR